MTPTRDGSIPVGDEQDGYQSKQVRANVKTGRIQDRPGELNCYACGCWIQRDSAGAHIIEWCPIMAAAPDLYEFVQMIANGGLDSGVDHATIEAEAQAALARVKGE